MPLKRVEFLEQKINKKIVSRLFFVELKSINSVLDTLNNCFYQIDENGVAVLHMMAMHGEGAVVPRTTMASRVSENFEQTLARLLRRDIIEQVGEPQRPVVPARSTWRAQRVPVSQPGEGYRFQVELVRRWFVQT